MAVAPTHALPRLAPPDPTGHDVTTVLLLDEDPDLLGPLDATLVEAARQQLLARAMWLEPGRWAPLGNDLPRRFDGWLGMLVLDGLLVRQLEVDGRQLQVDGLRCCELLGPGDVLRPWDEDGGTMTLEAQARWRVLEPTRVALLDAAFARRASRWPGLPQQLMQRTLARSRSLSVLLALTQARRADVRVRTLFWHLADRWGRMTPGGVVLPLNLTHDVIAQLTGLRRPSVSLTLGELERSGEILRLDKANWILAHPA